MFITQWSAYTQLLLYFFMGCGWKAPGKRHCLSLELRPTHLWHFVQLQKCSNLGWIYWCSSCNYGQRFPLSLAVVVRGSLFPFREPKQGTFQSPVVTFKGTVEIIIQGHVGKEMRVLADLHNGKAKSQDILIIPEKPPKQRGLPGSSPGWSRVFEAGTASATYLYLFIHQRFKE